MYRTSGLIVLALGAALTYSLVFTTFDQPVMSWTTTEDGNIERDTVPCPTPWEILFNADMPDTRVQTWRDLCVRSARTLFTEGIVVTAAALVVGLRAVVRGPKPTPKPLRPLSELLGEDFMARHSR